MLKILLSFYFLALISVSLARALIRGAESLPFQVLMSVLIGPPWERTDITHHAPLLRARSGQGGEEAEAAWPWERCRDDARVRSYVLQQGDAQDCGVLHWGRAGGQVLHTVQHRGQPGL